MLDIITPKEAHEVAVSHGFYDGHEPGRNIGEALCLIHSEISEALDGHRKDIPKGDHGWIGEELADAVIRIWDLCEYLNIDIADEVNKKHEINKSRPYKHGKKY